MSDDLTAENDRSMDAMFDVLSNEPRRVILEYLLGTNGPVGVVELVDYVVAEINWEDAGSQDLRTRAEVNLRHIHLPKMIDAGVVKYELDRRTVEITDIGREAEQYLDIEQPDDF